MFFEDIYWKVVFACFGFLFIRMIAVTVVRIREAVSEYSHSVHSVHAWVVVVG